jgi:hypothetical protein
MRQHISKQHSVHVSRWSTPSAASYKAHAAQLWKPVKVQTFFTEKRFVHYFVVREEGSEAEGEASTIGAIPLARKAEAGCHQAVGALGQQQQQHSNSERTAKQRTYVLRLPQQLICHKVHHRPFSSGQVHFLAALGINLETNRLSPVDPLYTVLIDNLHNISRLCSEDRYFMGLAKDPDRYIGRMLRCILRRMLWQCI